ncbi:MAG: GNAT family N-acetyltransferase [Butyrivibrio sp.]|uniref:GNAT family N-acetyltransferase n=1 Tax=Butyrivibrio sp. TaxID=28121 RepID=UPI001B07F6A0|nr:GNAT family N-acetyltransferase [Butyrivibrio sp.]MBO6239961.1 GNAT family N-acetyltransferase [Butyrivibrio sp.]
MIRKAQITDIPRMITLLNQVLEIHAKIRPDIFVSGKTKYTVEQLEDILKDETRPVYIFADDNDECMGYCFCQIKDIPKAEFMAPIKILFIDDLCVDESKRGEHIGRKLFDHIKEEAKKLGCYEVTLNVWEGNDSAIAFYKNMNMKVKEYQMELIL